MSLFNLPHPSLGSSNGLDGVSLASIDFSQVGESAIYAALALVILLVVLLVAAKVMPFSIKKEIEEDQNTSLGIIMGSVVLGICYIIGRTFGGP